VSREDIIRYNETRSTDEAQENGRKGGKASGASRRRKRSLKEAADLFLSLPVTDTKTHNKMIRAGVDADDIDYQMAVVIGMTTKAIKGDAKAAKVLIEMLGGTKEEDAQQNTLDKLDSVLDEIGGVI
jgi:hypothetical protein